MKRSGLLPMTDFKLLDETSVLDCLPKDDRPDKDFGGYDDPLTNAFLGGVATCRKNIKALPATKIPQDLIKDWILVLPERLKELEQKEKQLVFLRLAIDEVDELYRQELTDV